MEEKIQWYKEVLTLEPNSKLFFPLAVLLSKNGQIEEALDTLRTGLSRHEEYLEARLFYIELLFTTRDNSSSSEEIAREFGKLEEMFSHYTGFWKAWAAYIQESDTSGDAPSVMRFLSLYFSHKTLSLQTVIEKGLQAIMLRDDAERESAHTLFPDPVKKTGGESDLPAQDNASVPTPAHDDSIQNAVQDVSQSETFSSEAADSAVEPSELSLEADGDSALTVEQESSLAQGDAHTLKEDAQIEASLSSDASSDQSETSFDPLYADPVAAGSAVYADAELSNEESGTAVSAMPIVDTEGSADTESEEEHISLRTRSMAEILAEQGDIKGALDIYYELEAAAASVEESADLRQRITTLRSLLTPQQPQHADKSEPEDKKRVITIIEALTERLEARAQH